MVNPDGSIDKIKEKEEEERRIKEEAERKLKEEEEKRKFSKFIRKDGSQVEVAVDTELGYLITSKVPQDQEEFERLWSTLMKLYFKIPTH